MTLQDIIERTAAIIGVEESALNMPTQIYNKIRDSVVTVYTELITEFVPLRTKEKVNISGGKLFYEDLTYRVREILAIKTSVGRLKFNEYPEYVQTDNYDGEAEIEYFQHLVRQVPVPDSLYEYVVRLVASTRPDRADAPEITKKYVSWGAGPRASQYLIVGAKCHAALHGKFSPDKEDVRAVALQTLRHRVVKNYKAEAEGLGIDEILKSLF